MLSTMLTVLWFLSRGPGTWYRPPDTLEVHAAYQRHQSTSAHRVPHSVRPHRPPFNKPDAANPAIGSRSIPGVAGAGSLIWGVGRPEPMTKTLLLLALLIRSEEHTSELQSLRHL